MGDQLHQFPFLRDEALASFMRVWDATVRLPLENVTTDPEIANEAPWHGAVAWIGGDWTGNVRLLVSPSLANDIAKALFNGLIDEPPEGYSPEEVDDALRELSNMVAGNLKGSLAGVCGLATPGTFIVRSNAEFRNEFDQILHQSFRCGAGFIVLSLGELRTL